MELVSCFKTRFFFIFLFATDPFKKKKVEMGNGCQLVYLDFTVCN